MKRVNSLKKGFTMFVLGTMVLSSYVLAQASEIATPLTCETPLIHENKWKYHHYGFMIILKQLK